ncbi:hypothetical protein QLQ15_02325 [Lysobacter sp. LF1]|uniref:Uncharacterized protein n=1 Tax=Lysobacter stagni TaxID=3045172 RepID=A0ABT6XC77_9GAMM|nr:hypothetical protein [Lysobacter sp. LF1]MDI9237745.1 hypothetical protein [Lysobacter sp. LF1]
MRADKQKAGARRKPATKTERAPAKPAHAAEVKPKPASDERTTERVMRHRDGHTLH